MADAKISALTTIPTVDAVADYLPIVDTSGGTSNKVTLNGLLGITGSPVGHSDSQTLSNKTLGITNSITVKASLFIIQDQTDTTKQAKFDASGITTATTRTYALPDANTTLVGIGTTQTLTNKTLTSPTLNTPTIVNPTITVDTVSEYTAANGVTVDGLNIKDSALNTNNSVNTANITDAAVTPAKLQSGTGSSWVWTAYTPTITASAGTFTTVSATGRWIQIGKTAHVHIVITITTNGTAATAIIATLPTATINTSGMMLGYGREDGVTGNMMQAKQGSTASLANIYKYDGTYLGGNGGIPKLLMTYEVA